MSQLTDEMKTDRDEREEASLKHFNDWSRTYEGSIAQRFFFDRIHKAVLAQAKKVAEPGILLDVGCGTGRLLRAAATLWPSASLIGVDAADGMVEVARALTPEATVHLGTAETLPLPDASVDLAVSTVSFHHWGDQSAGIREIARVLRPGGHFFLADSAPPTWMMKWTNRSGHSLFQSKARVRILFEGAGLHVIVQKWILLPFMTLTGAVRNEKTENGEGN
jgi:ubiquinone/menaquinone biosynthesis C-methylase UbiE